MDGDGNMIKKPQVGCVSYCEWFLNSVMLTGAFHRLDFSFFSTHLP